MSISARHPSQPTDGDTSKSRAAPNLRNLRFDVNRRPFLVLFELTRACDLACRHCRTEAMTKADPDDLKTWEVLRVLTDLASLGAPRPIVVLTGGDPLRRKDLSEIVAHGAGLGLSMAVSPAGTSRADFSSLSLLREAGAHAVSFSLDGATADVHDAFRGTPGSFEATVGGCRAAVKAKLRLQVNTTVCVDTVGDLPYVSHLVASLGASLWSVFFLVPVGRGRDLEPLSAVQSEDVLTFLYEVSAYMSLKTTEAPHYRRIVLRDRARGTAPEPGPLYHQLHEVFAGMDLSVFDRGKSVIAHPSRSTLNVGDGRGVVFISHRGVVQPSGFLPLALGNVRKQSICEIYATSRVIKSLRDPNAIGTRCRLCDFSEVCGGSRAQAYALTGNALADDPTCAYDPFALKILPRA